MPKARLLKELLSVLDRQTGEKSHTSSSRNWGRVAHKASLGPCTVRSSVAFCILLAIASLPRCT